MLFFCRAAVMGAKTAAYNGVRLWDCELRRLAKVWLVDFAAESCVWYKQWWRRRFPRRMKVGENERQEAVWLLELPWTRQEWAVLPEAKGRKWLLKNLRRLGKAEGRLGEDWRLGLPLLLAETVGAEYPQVLAAARRVACREWLRQTEQKLGLIPGRQVGILGLDAAWQEDLVTDLLGRGCRVALYGEWAKRAAEKWWRQGVALPELSARRMLSDCEAVLLLRTEIWQGGEDKGRLAVWREPLVWVPGRFGGRYSFGMMAAGNAAAASGEVISNK